MNSDTLKPLKKCGTISIAEIAERHALGQSVNLIDVRTPVEFETMHAEGARLIPLDKLDPAAVLAACGDASDAAIYLICQSGGRAAKACEKLQAAGFTNVFSIEGGTAAWERAGLPVVPKASKVISLERQVRIAAGLLVLVGVFLGWLVHPALYSISAYIGGGLVFSGIADWCGMGVLLAKMPWNQESAAKRRVSDFQCKP